MKIRLQLLLLVIPILATSQNLVRCNDTTSFFVTQNENFNCYIKLTGKVTDTENSKVIAISNYALQTLLINKQNYLSSGKEDIPILTQYMLSETQYYTSIYKEKLNLMMIPLKISNDKKAVIWYFDIPENKQVQVQIGQTPAVRQVTVSIIIDDYIYSVGATQFKDQSYEELQKLLSDLILTIKFNKGNLDQSKLCIKN